MIQKNVRSVSLNTQSLIMYVMILTKHAYDNSKISSLVGLGSRTHILRFFYRMNSYFMGMT